jgi:hypothetical protein
MDIISNLRDWFYYSLVAVSRKPRYIPETEHKRPQSPDKIINLKER